MNGIDGAAATQPATQPVYLKGVARLWRWPPAVSTSQWAEQFRVLPRKSSRRAGPWRNSASPYLVGVMDAFSTSGVEMIVLMFAAQTGKTEATNNMIGWAAHCQPDPMMLVLPDERLGKRTVNHRLRPLMEATPVLAELIPGPRSITHTSVSLANGFMLSLAWAGSPAALASMPCRYVIMDEADKYPRYSGREADPVDLASVRTQTYGRDRKIVLVSTPTTDSGPTTRAYDTCSQRLGYWVPCPLCGWFQLLDDGRLRWDARDGVAPATLAVIIQETRQVWYECEKCAGHIEQRHKPDILAAGLWAEHAAERDDMGKPQVPQLRQSVGFQLSALYPVWVDFADYAAEMIRSRDEAVRRFHFANSWRGQPYREQIGGSLRTQVQGVRSVTPDGVAPEWARALLVGIDCQAGHYYYVVRAFGYMARSQLVACGVAESLEWITTNVLRRPWPTVDGRELVISQAAIDSGYKPMDAYQFCASHGGKVVPTKGENRGPSVHDFVRKRRRRAGFGAKAQTDMLWMLNTHALKDQLVSLLGDVVPQTVDPGKTAPRWATNAAADQEYEAQLCAEQKVIVRRNRAAPIESWEPVHSRDNHYLDCEVMILALASEAGFERIPVPSSVAAARGAADAQRKRAQEAQQGASMLRGGGRTFRRNYG